MKKEFIKQTHRWLLIFAVLFSAVTTWAQATEFTYQGKLSDMGTPTATYDFQFRLCATETASCTTPLATFSQTDVTVTGGIFTVKVNFPATQFNGADKFLEIAVKRTGEANYVTLSPRQKITSVPYSIQSLKSVDTIYFGGMPLEDFVLENDARLQPNYSVLNSTTTQSGVNFNIGGTGTASILNAATQFNLNGQRFLAGGTPNSGNTYLGYTSGQAMTTGTSNTFIGKDTGFRNTTGSSNAFFGGSAGFNNTEGLQNSFFGVGTGTQNTTGNNNSFFGSGAGQQSTTGASNAFFGWRAGDFNKTGANNTVVGASADVGADNLIYATAIGAGAVVNTNNTIVLGRSADNVQIPGTFTTNALNVTTQYNLGGSRILSNAGTNNLFVGVGTAGAGFNTGANNSFVGFEAGRTNSSGSENSFFGWEAGKGNTIGFYNSFFGSTTGRNNTSGDRNTFIGVNAGYNNTFGDDNIYIGAFTSNANINTQLNNSIAIGNNVTVAASNTIQLGKFDQNTIIRGNIRVFAGRNDNINQNPAFESIYTTTYGYGLGTPKLYTNITDAVYTESPMCLQQVGLGIGYGHVGYCANGTGSRNLKKDIKAFSGGLEIVKRLNPVVFKWKETGEPGIGLNAEDVAAAEPQLINRDEKGDIRDVKTQALNVVLINAVKEQQAQIEAQRKEIDQLKKIVCAVNTTAEICKEK